MTRGKIEMYEKVAEIGTRRAERVMWCNCYRARGSAGRGLTSSAGAVSSLSVEGGWGWGI